MYSGPKADYSAMVDGNLAVRAFAKLREDGPVEFSKATSTFLNHRYRRLLLTTERYRHEWKWGESCPDPFRLIYANPRDVNYYLLESDITDPHYGTELENDVQDLYQTDKARFKRRWNLGRIIGGNWDKQREDWENHDLYRSLKAVYNEGEEWENTDFVQSCLARIERGYSSYGYDSKEEFLDKRISYIDSLYRDMKENGYRTQEAAPNDHRNKDILHEVTVNIGRNGELIFNNETGHHRLSLARILGIDRIPMLVVVRHRRWQELRNEIYNNGFSEDPGEGIRNHPDLQDILN